MNAWLARALDRWIIHLACRFDSRSAPPPSPEPTASALIHSDSLFCEPIKPPSDWRWDGGGAFRFTSPVRTRLGQTDTVFGKFFPAADKWAKQPTAVLLHGWNAELCYRRLFPYLASRLRRAGVITATIELPYHMQRRPGHGPVTDFISSDLASMLEATHQAVADTRAVCRWFENEGSSSLGLWGFSLGAWLVGLTLRREPRLRAAVLTTPIARLDRAIADLAFCAPVRRGLQNQALELEWLNLDWQSPLMSPERILLVQSRHDLFAPAETVDQLWDAWQRPNMWRLPHGHISILFSPGSLKRTASWMGKQLS